MARFSLVLKSKEVELVDDKGEVKVYVVRELTGAQRDKFLNIVGNKISYNAQGKAVVKDFEGFQSNLLINCLYDNNNKLVAAKEIELWPSSLVNELFKIAQNLSGLDAVSEEEAKNA